jgi:hypothetical protein
LTENQHVLVWAIGYGLMINGIKKCEIRIGIWVN